LSVLPPSDNSISVSNNDNNRDIIITLHTESVINKKIYINLHRYGRTLLLLYPDHCWE
jgi:hypothetical protein